MFKLIAILNVIAWAGFWAFGYIALTSHDLTQGQVVIAMMLAFAGLVSGIWAYMRLIRHTETLGYAKPTKQLTVEDLARAQQQWEG